MKHIELLEEAEDCRRRALAYVGQPEAKLLLRVAKEFEGLNAETSAACAALPFSPRYRTHSEPKRPIHSSWLYKPR